MRGDRTRRCLRALRRFASSMPRKCLLNCLSGVRLAGRRLIVPLTGARAGGFSLPLLDDCDALIEGAEQFISSVCRRSLKFCHFDQLRRAPAARRWQL